MEQKERESENIELRSEKVRNVIGKVPPRLVSLGTVVITIIVLALAVAFYKIPYPISIDANGEVAFSKNISAAEWEASKIPTQGQAGKTQIPLASISKVTSI